MSKELIIVESPSKVKTLKKMLGDKYVFESSVGHIIDLPNKSLGVNLETFDPEYKVLEGKEKIVQNLISTAKKCKKVYLCPDPDREGEAIAWHLRSILPSDTLTFRVKFNSITKKEVLRSLENPCDIDINLVNAQQARRVLDRLVGYTISPLLVRRVRRGRNSNEGSLSAGRVQSVALKFVVDRENEIEAFQSKEYWNVHSVFVNNKKENISSVLVLFNGKKIKRLPDDSGDILIDSEKLIKEIITSLERQKFFISSIDKKQKFRHPTPPFITSTLQQESSRVLGFSPSKTMSIAQSLYEGVECGEKGPEGIVTYIRTDSVRSSQEAIDAARNIIISMYGKDFVPNSPKHYVTSKSAQDSHECIRPADVQNSPDKLKEFLSKDQYKLYEIIWKRFIASQMSSAVYDITTVSIQGSKDSLFKASGSSISFKGFLSVYTDDDDTYLDGSTIGKFEVGESVNPLFEPVQSFTKPPSRYTEASLIKELEKSGIGRPSTYASIMSKIQDRSYTEKEKGRLKPTDLGVVVEKTLTINFPKIMDLAFTANMEDDLEKISEGLINWKEVLSSFWSMFEPVLKEAEKSLVVPKEQVDKKCPLCGKFLNKIWSRNSFFLGCSGYPDCNYTSNLDDGHKPDVHPDFDLNQKCPNCNCEMILRNGRYGAFLGCCKFPKCRGIVSIPKPDEELNEESISCPAIGCCGKVSFKKSRFGKLFCGCSQYPDCDVIGNDFDSVLSKFSNHEKTAVVKKTKTKKLKAKVQKFSECLSELIGIKEGTKQDAIKAVFKYIKDNNLQDKEDKRYFIAERDKKLRKFFLDEGKIHIFKVSKMVSDNIVKE